MTSFAVGGMDLGVWVDVGVLSRRAAGGATHLKLAWMLGQQEQIKQMEVKEKKFHSFPAADWFALIFYVQCPRVYSKYRITIKRVNTDVSCKVKTVFLILATSLSSFCLSSIFLVCCY